MLARAALRALVEMTGLTRARALALLAPLLLVAGLPSALSYSEAGLTVLGRPVLDPMDELVGTVGLSLGVLITTVALGWLGRQHHRAAAVGPGFVAGPVSGWCGWPSPSALAWRWRGCSSPDPSGLPYDDHGEWGGLYHSLGDAPQQELLPDATGMGPHPDGVGVKIEGLLDDLGRHTAQAQLLHDNPLPDLDAGRQLQGQSRQGLLPGLDLALLVRIAQGGKVNGLQEDGHPPRFQQGGQALDDRR